MCAANSICVYFGTYCCAGVGGRPSKKSIYLNESIYDHFDLHKNRQIKLRTTKCRMQTRADARFWFPSSSVFIFLLLSFPLSFSLLCWVDFVINDIWDLAAIANGIHNNNHKINNRQNEIYANDMFIFRNGA